MANNVSLIQTLVNTTLDSQALGPNNVALNQTCDDTVLTSPLQLGRVFTAQVYLAETKLSSYLTLGDRPENPALVPITPVIQNLGGSVHVGGATLLCFIGPPDRTVEWHMIRGSGTLLPLTLMTDAHGRATCKFQAGNIAETAEVGVVYVP